MSAAVKRASVAASVLCLLLLSACADHAQIMAQLEKDRENALATLNWLPFLAWFLVVAAIGIWAASLAVTMNGTKAATLLKEQIAETSARRRQLADEREDAEGAAFDACRVRGDAEGLHRSFEDEPRPEETV